MSDPPTWPNQVSGWAPGPGTVVQDRRGGAGRRAISMIVVLWASRTRSDHAGCDPLQVHLGCAPQKITPIPSFSSLSCYQVRTLLLAPIYKLYIRVDSESIMWLASSLKMVYVLIEKYSKMECYMCIPAPVATPCIPNPFTVSSKTRTTSSVMGVYTCHYLYGLSDHQYGHPQVIGNI